MSLSMRLSAQQSAAAAAAAAAAPRRASQATSQPRAPTHLPRAPSLGDRSSSSGSVTRRAASGLLTAAVSGELVAELFDSTAEALGDISKLGCIAESGAGAAAATCSGLAGWLVEKAAPAALAAIGLEADVTGLAAKAFAALDLGADGPSLGGVATRVGVAVLAAVALSRWLAAARADTAQAAVLARTLSPAASLGSSCGSGSGGDALAAALSGATGAGNSSSSSGEGASAPNSQAPLARIATAVVDGQVARAQKLARRAAAVVSSDSTPPVAAAVVLLEGAALAHSYAELASGAAYVVSPVLRACGVDIGC